MERDLPEEPSSPEAESGNRIHEYLAGSQSVVLSDDEMATAQACQSQAETLKGEVFGERGFHFEFRERRLWAYSPDDSRAWSGKPDLICNRGDHAIVIDYKTGRTEVETATGNLQLRALAVLAWREYEVESVTVAIVQPLAGDPSVCRYEGDDLKRAAIEIETLVQRIQTPGKPRIPSEAACKYCKAKAICPEARNAALTGPLSNVPEGTTVEHIAAVLSNDTLADFLERSQLATRVIDACKDEAKRRLEAGETIPGWTLKPGSNRETITDPQRVFERFSELGGTQERFLGAITVAKSKLKEAVGFTAGLKGRALDERLKDLLRGCTETTTTAPSLARTKGEA